MKMSKTMRKVLAVLLVAVMTMLCLVGCQQGAKEEAPADPAPSAPATETTTPEPEPEPEPWKPERTITMYVGFNAGGGVDTMARVLATELSSYLGVDVVVENMPGGGSGTAAEHVMGLDADGYTLLAVSSACATYAAMDNSDATYNEMDMLGVMVLSEPAFEVPGTSSINTMDDLVALWNSGEAHTAANAGNGGLWHIPQLLAMQAAGADMSKVSFVPYSSGKEDATAIAKGEVDWGVTGAFLESAEFCIEGMSKPLCIFSDQAYEVPGYGTLEPITKFIPELTAEDIGAGAGWRGVLVKEGTPEEIYTVLEDALKAAYESDAFQTLIEENGLIPAGYFGDQAQDTYEYTTQVQSWLLYDMEMANRSPEDLDIPRAS